MLSFLFLYLLFSYNETRYCCASPSSVTHHVLFDPKVVFLSLNRLAKSDGKEKKGANSHRSSSFVSKSNGTAEKQTEVTYLMSKTKLFPPFCSEIST